MNAPAAYQTYQQTQIETASPAKLLLMLYSGAITRLQRAKGELADSDYISTHLSLVKVQDIVLELMVSLDWESSPELCSRLHGLYDYVYRRLVYANVHKMDEPIEESIQILTELHSGWQEAISSLDATSTPAPARTLPGANSSRLNLRG